jgi:hypothetical protein
MYAWLERGGTSACTAAVLRAQDVGKRTHVRMQKQRSVTCNSNGTGALDIGESSKRHLP